MSRTQRNRPAAESRTDHLTESERHALLAVEERRLALDALSERASAVDLEELAVEVATRRDGPSAARRDDVEQLTTALHHAHLPRMDDLDVLDYDPETNVANPEPC